MNIKIEANKRNYVLNANRLSTNTESATVSIMYDRGTTGGDTRVTSGGDIRVILISQTVYPVNVLANKRNYVLNAPLIKVQ